MSYVMILMNVDPARGLYNGTRLIVTKLGKGLIEAEPIFGKYRVIKC